MHDDNGSDSHTCQRHGAHDALLVVDMQVDCVHPRDGALYVPRAETLLPRINRLLACRGFGVRVATLDWHPPTHCSFAVNGGTWPTHCVAHTPGAALHSDLCITHVDVYIRKGTAVDADSYSAFADDRGAATPLHARLRAAHVTRVFVCGVAYDYCVYYTAMDARRLGYDVVLLERCCCAVDADTRAPQCRAAMREAGVVIVSDDDDDDDDKAGACGCGSVHDAA